MEYRIVKKQHCDEIYYQVQHKVLFWWFYNYQYDSEGSIYDLIFKTEDEANKWICNERPPRILEYILPKKQE